MKEITDENFETEVLQADKPVLVDFWASWCGPCRQLGPVVEELAAEMEDQVKIVKVNVDDAPATPSKFGVRGIPTLMLFRDGQVASTKVGALQKSKLQEWIESEIA